MQKAQFRSFSTGKLTHENLFPSHIKTLTHISYSTVKKTNYTRFKQYNNTERNAIQYYSPKKILHSVNLTVITSIILEINQQNEKQYTLLKISASHVSQTRPKILFTKLRTTILKQFLIIIRCCTNFQKSYTPQEFDLIIQSKQSKKSLQNLTQIQEQKLSEHFNKEFKLTQKQKQYAENMYKNTSLSSIKTQINIDIHVNIKIIQYK
eukprot:TRINITY_DN25974_c0_g1_i1.p1 TRINITY_DN25974_c0_g1~~TRINITY_DN25974_c0_g1_i1.p1  ORF type:complete len:208 (+),score=-13.71 TRINITY_DN25974_c0_g1_i1:421-1044(+)